MAEPDLKCRRDPTPSFSGKRDLSQFVIGLIVVQHFRVPVHGETRGSSCPAVMRAMPHSFWRIDDVALIGEEDRQRTNLVFDNMFVPEAVKHEGYIRVKMLKRRTIIQGTAPANHNYRFELEFESEELRQKWIASPEHQRVWPPVEKTMTTQKNYPVVLYDEV